MKQKLPFLLSLSLLGVFLSFYVFGLIKSEKSRLEGEIGLLFTNSLQNIENSLFKNMLFSKDKLTINGSGKNKLQVVTKNIKVAQKDQISIQITSDSDNKDSLKIKSLSSDILKAINSPKQTKDVSGMISIFFKDKPRAAFEKIVKETVNEQLNKDVKKAKIEVKYAVSFDSTLNREKLLIRYVDIGNDAKFYLSWVNVYPLVFQRIWLEILLALLLYFSLCLAYYFSEKNHKKQREWLVQKNGFVSNLTHELKTPLATVNVALEALQNFDVTDPAKRNEYIAIAKNEANRLNVLINNVLNFSKHSATLAAVDLKEQFDLLFPAWQLRADATGFELKLAIESDLPRVNANDELVAIVLNNLVDNALSYCRNEKPQISISAYSKNKNVQISISDNGKPGIDMALKDQIFEKFFRIPEPGSQHAVKGHGMGLFIVAELCQTMGGRVWLENKNTFIVSLKHA